MENALWWSDHTLDRSVDEDVGALRAFIGARVRLLPVGGEAPDNDAEVTEEEREQLLTDFLDSAEGARWRGDEDAEDVAHLAVEFGSGYNHGGPLRWSPVVVEIFMTSWLPRKVARERPLYERVPEMLRDWVVYAGRHRGVPAARVDEVLAAVDACRDEMLETVEDPAAWGPAKAFGVAAQEAGVDLTDPEQVEGFVARYNSGLAA